MKVNIIRIILADENRLFIDSLMMLIERMRLRLKVVDTAKSGPDVLKKIKKKQPDILLLDIDLPEIDGPEFIKLIRSESPKTKIVILTTNGESHFIKECLKNEISAYLLKDIPLSELITMFPLINNKTTILSRELVPLIAENPSSSFKDSKKKNTFAPLQSNFSEREKKLIALIIQGLSNREIAEKMFLAEQTVKNYVSLLYDKLGVHNRAQAIRTSKSLILL